MQLKWGEEEVWETIALPFRKLKQAKTQFDWQYEAFCVVDDCIHKLWIDVDHMCEWLRWLSKYFISAITKNNGKQELLKNQNKFSTKLILFFGIGNSKTNARRYMKCSLNVYINIPLAILYRFTIKLSKYFDLPWAVNGHYKFHFF